MVALGQVYLESFDRSLNANNVGIAHPSGPSQFPSSARLCAIVGINFHIAPTPIAGYAPAVSAISDCSSRETMSVSSPASPPASPKVSP